MPRIGKSFLILLLNTDDRAEPGSRLVHATKFGWGEMGELFFENFLEHVATWDSEAGRMKCCTITRANHSAGPWFEPFVVVRDGEKKRLVPVDAVWPEGAFAFLDYEQIVRCGYEPYAVEAEREKANGN